VANLYASSVANRVQAPLGRGLFVAIVEDDYQAGWLHEFLPQDGELRNAATGVRGYSASPSVQFGSDVPGEGYERVPRPQFGLLYPARNRRFKP